MAPLKKRFRFRFRQLGQILVWLGIIGLLVPASETLPRPAVILLPAGVLFFTIGWLRNER